MACRNAASETSASSNSTRADRVPRLTFALVTPGIFRRVRSLRTEHAAQCMPPIAKVAVVMAQTPFGDRGYPRLFATTVNLDPGVIIPIPQLKPKSPVSCGMKEIRVLLFDDRSLRT